FAVGATGELPADAAIEQRKLPADFIVSELRCRVEQVLEQVSQSTHDLDGASAVLAQFVGGEPNVAVEVGARQYQDRAAALAPARVGKRRTARRRNGSWIWHTSHAGYGSRLDNA